MDKNVVISEVSKIVAEFSKTPYEVNPRAKKVFLSAGDTDEYHVLGNLLSEIYVSDSPCRKVLDTTGLTCEVMVGENFDSEYKKQLKELADKVSAIILHDHVDNMAELMSSCDFAVSAGGRVIYQLCSVGVPTVVFSMSDPEAEFVQYFDSVGAAKYAGDARKDKRLFQKIATWGTAAVDNQGFRARMSKNAKEISSEKNIENIAELILKVTK
ncbi:hypothetical protein [Butyrivibrio sp. VCB2006]|uniref:hypothetical protein n=1 Tax=Butyrivibrio sp. VCB2006 TaxID=1280679 RepID=UPI00041A2108|nr:hypothetical protein [Butyrivibrio sp. VCB2006]